MSLTCYEACMTVHAKASRSSTLGQDGQLDGAAPLGGVLDPGGILLGLLAKEGLVVGAAVCQHSICNHLPAQHATPLEALQQALMCETPFRYALETETGECRSESLCWFSWSEHTGKLYVGSAPQEGEGQGLPELRTFAAEALHDVGTGSKQAAIVVRHDATGDEDVAPLVGMLIAHCKDTQASAICRQRCWLQQGLCHIPIPVLLDATPSTLIPSRQRGR